MIPYLATIKWSGKKHPSQKVGARNKVRKGYRYPATAQTYPRPARGKKIQIWYDNAKLKRLADLNSWYGFFAIRRIGGFLFNRNQPKLKQRPWPLRSYIPWYFKEGEAALAENILCEGNVIRILARRGSWCRIDPTIIGRLTEVEYKTGIRHNGALRWPIYPDPKTGEIWMEASRLKKL